MDEFKDALRQTTLCVDTADGDEDVDLDSLADQYTSVITSIADRLVPMRTVTCRRRASDVWFDDECRAARKKCRRLERRCNRSPAYKKEWQLEFRRYRQLTRRKRAEFWRTYIDENRRQPQRLWRSIDKLMGREKLAASPDITASDFQHFFLDKVAAVRASTDGADDPAFRQSSQVTVLNVLKPVDLEEVTSLISSLPNKCKENRRSLRSYRTCGPLFFILLILPPKFSTLPHLNPTTGG